MELALQIFLLSNVFLLGVAAVLATQFALAHFRHEKHKPTDIPHAGNQTVVRLPQASKEQLLHIAEMNYKAVLDRSALELENDLQHTAERLNKQFEHLGQIVAHSESERYQTMLEALRVKAETTIRNAQAQLGSHQNELRTKMAEEIQAEKKMLIEQIDTKLADAVASFLSETLGHSVDLGAQGPWIMAQLEAHKAELKEGISK